MNTFHLYQLIQRELVQQVLDDIDDVYLVHLQNRITVQVSMNIKEILLCLSQLYRKITPKITQAIQINYRNGV